MQSEWATVKRHSSEDIFGIQITSNHPLQLSKAIDIIDSHLTVDFVDLNLGCPVEGICARGYGSALMERRAKLREMVLGSVIYPTPITIKLRTGVRDKTLLAHKLVPEFEEWGVQGVTLHGRTKEQRYAREADWGYIKDCGKLITKPFYFGNGDCFSSEDYEKMKEGVDGVMIGRGALIKPWVFTEIKEGKVWDITSTERLEILKKYANYGVFRVI